MDRLKGKISIVTGGAHGIGKATAEAFAEEGAWVLIVDVDKDAGEETAETIRLSGGQAIYFPADISDQNQVARAVKQAGVEAGKVDILCNNAAYLVPWHNVVDAPDEEWNQCISVTLLGAAHFIKAVLPWMLPQRSGSIINIASAQGIVGEKNSVAYTAVKHGVIGLTRSVACDYGAHNIRCNAICPGPINARHAPPPEDEKYKRQVKKTPLGRFGEPREVGTAAVFLASDESSFITGAVVPVDGGWTAI